MTNADIRKAHKLLDYVSQGRAVLDEEIELLRSFLPDLPKQKTLEEIVEHVRDAWVGASGNKWVGNSYNTEITLESWLGELYVQLQGLAGAEPDKPTHPKFLETEADYENAPEGTIVACDDSPPYHKFGSEWSSIDFIEMKDDRGMSRAIRRVLRWGNE